jgi:hypothetical protein
MRATVKKRKKPATKAAVPEKGKPGPKPKPPDELVVKKSVSLRPETYDGLLKLGDGVLSQGIETMYAAKAKK